MARHSKPSAIVLNRSVEDGKGILLEVTLVFEGSLDLERIFRAGRDRLKDLLQALDITVERIDKHTK